MRIRLLGPVELEVAGGGLATLAGAQRRAVLALPALRLGRVVTMDQFCELLWGERSPASARAAVQGHVAALRKVLADTPFELHTRAGGYLLSGPAEEVDALRFTALAERAGERADRGDGAGAIALLEEALQLWRGEALADLPDTPLRAATVEHLKQSSTAALLRWAGLRLRQGTGAAAVAVLEQSVRRDGLREELVALLMRCLQQAGRTADALNAYHRARLRLDRELGIRPGPALRAAFAEVLADDRPEAPPATPAAVPAEAPAAAPPAARSGYQAPQQLPRQRVELIGRTAEAQWLDRACAPDRATDGPALVVGPAGIGKSALVTAWAHRAAERFPDGRLYADLRGLDPAGPAEPGAVLGRFLRALGVPDDAVPTDPADRAALYREHTRGRRLLVVLDDAADADQLTDLLPDGPGCAVVITARGSLEKLVATEDAALLRLTALPEGDALGLLEHLLTPGRLRAEPEAGAELVRLCEQLPLALRIAAARLTAHPSWTLTDLVAELADERTRLAALELDAHTGLRQQLRLTLHHISAQAVELLALLALHPGREVDGQAAAALLGTDTTTAHRALGELASHHLLTGAARGRYHRSDLVRLFSADLLAEQSAPSEQRREHALLRLLDHYRAALQRCGSYLDPGQEDPGAPALPPQPLPPVVDIRTALDWFRAEEPAVRMLIDRAAVSHPDRAWRLALTTGSLYYGASRFTDWLARADVGLAAAERCADPVAVAFLHNCRAQALVALERRHESAEAARKGVAAAESAEGPAADSARVRSLATLGLVTAMLGDPAEARRLAAGATALAVESGNRERLVDALVHQGWVSLATGDPAGAERWSREARELLPPRPVTQVHLWSLLTEAQALPPTAREETADLAWHRLLAACEEAGLLYLHAVAEQSYAAHLVARGRAPEVRARLASALERFRRHDRLAGHRSELTAGLESSLSLRTP
ncbi:BTAD domain-containing putative transcriptional regulator [Kitasatospora aureofaciens]|uniref:AfsR/SARP family transcriptional regulator n=1 Tax=Kitasatospora aureofaciens TaxID=1894 RepID=UPI001DBD2AB6|nr:BTAD domain-containing putative transcriptional regulator [Kitasatospora aureofaciens]HJD84698.1 hypothetical protein [Kitasatospora aureofaciens]